MTIWRKLKCCWCILRYKEWYFAVVTDRYKDGKPLATAITSSKDTETATKKLIKGLQEYLKKQRHEKSKRAR